MKDTIYRADAIEAVCRTRCGDKVKGCPAHSCLVIEEFDALPSAETHEIRTETHGVCSDLISRADAIEAMWKALYAYQDITEKQFQANEELDLADWFQHRIFVQRMHEECMKAVNSLQSAEAETTVIRSRTLMPTEDFKEWAKRIREENPNAVIIPCDAEVVSAEAVEVDCDTEWVAVRRDEYEDFLASAEATCATCADRAVCIMSEPDGNWKACKKYRPIVAEDLNEAYKRGFEDAKGAYDIELARSAKPYYDEDDYWNGRQAEAVPHGRLIDADALKGKAQECATEAWKMNLTARIETVIHQFIDWIDEAPTAERWIPCSERLPKINQRVLLTTNEGRVLVGYREKPDLVWQVTEKDGRKHWVYDPENYTDDIEVLPKNEDCAFAKDDVYSDGFMSVTSVNYDDRFEGVTAWMPLPEPYRKDGEVE